MFIRIKTIYATLLYVCLVMSVGLNYMTLRGQLDMVGYLADKPIPVAKSEPQSPFDYLSEIEKNTQPVDLYKGKKKVKG